MEGADGLAGPRSTPRVAFVSFSWGELNFRLTAALADHCEVLLITSEEQATAHRHLHDPRVRLLVQRLPRLRSAFGQLRAHWRAVQAIKKFAPDVIHMQHGHLWFNAMLRFLGAYPLVLTIHDPRFHLGDKSSARTPQWVYDRGFKRADLIIVQASQMIAPVVEEVGIDRERLRVVPLVQLGDQNLAVDVAEEEATVLWFGRIWAYKGLDLLIQAQPEVNRRVPEARFIIAGRGEDFAPYREAMADPDRFEVHNEFVTNELRAELFRRSTVVALPYREATQSGVVVNAFAYGKPVVATAVGGIQEQVDHDETGLLIPPNDLEALTDALVELLTDHDKRKRLGEAGQLKLESEWTAEHIAVKTVAVYREAMLNSRRR